MSATERWTNDDGLNVRFGTERAALSVEGHVSTMGDEQEAVFSITGTDITSADALLSAHPTVGIPDGSHIISATLYVTTAFTSGGSATLGWYRGSSLVRITVLRYRGLHGGCC